MDASLAVIVVVWVPLAGAEAVRGLHAWADTADRSDLAVPLLVPCRC